MSFFTRLLGTDEGQVPHPAGGASPPEGDDRAVERYRYMMKTAPPETIEQAHTEAFAKLSQAERRQVLNELAQVAPAKERAAIQNTSSDPRAVARVATRAEIREPGVMERTLGGSGFGVGGGLLGSFAAGFAGSLVAQSFFSALGGGFGGEGGAEGATTAGLDADGDQEGGGNFAEDVNEADGGDGFDGGDFDV